MSKARSNPLLLALVVIVAVAVSFVAWRPRASSSSSDSLLPSADVVSGAEHATALEPAPVVFDPLRHAEPDSRRVAESPRIRGRLVDSATGQPLAKWTVHLNCFNGAESVVVADPHDDPLGSMFVKFDTIGPGPRLVTTRIVPSSVLRGLDERGEVDEDEPPAPEPVLLGTVATDDSGLFEFECAEHSSLWLSLDDRPPLFAVPAWRGLDPSQACSRFVEWRVGIVERTVVHVRVVDDASNEPVPFLDVSLVGGSVSESIVTDAAGTATTQRPFDVGEVRAAFHDGPDECRVFAVEPKARIGTTSSTVTFRVTIGPTYRFAWRAGQGPDEARVRVRGLEPDSKDTSVCPAAGWHALRREDNGFLRYDAAVRIESGSRAFAEFQAADGLLRARVELTHVSGRGEPIPVAFTLATAIHGRVVDESGAGLHGARVFVLDARGETLDETFTDEQGQYFLGGLESTAVSSLLVLLPRFARATVDLSCVPGVDVVRDVTLSGF